MDILRKSRTVHHVDLDFKKRGTDKNLLFISDVHYDSVKCDRSLLHRHLEEARRIGAGVFIFGDLFDLMQGRFDPRGNYSELRPEYKSCTYVDEVMWARSWPNTRTSSDSSHEATTKPTSRNA
jgi:hypothetical protein